MDIIAHIKAYSLVIFLDEQKALGILMPKYVAENPYRPMQNLCPAVSPLKSLTPNCEIVYRYADFNGFDLCLMRFRVTLLGGGIVIRRCMYMRSARHSNSCDRTTLMALAL